MGIFIMSILTSLSGRSPMLLSGSVYFVALPGASQTDQGRGTRSERDKYLRR